MKKQGRLILVLLLLTAALVTGTRADIGPKASVQVSFRGLGEETCYGTLLSKERSTGPASAYSTEIGGRGREQYQDGRAVEGPEADAVWQAFQDYAREDDYYFLQHWWTCTGDGTISWTYYPPQEFKVLLYFPDSGRFCVSEETERYAFDSYFTAEPTAEGGLELRHSYRYGGELLGLAARVVLTILLELGVAWLFRYREKNVLILIGAVNVVTQIGLNVALNLINYKSGQMAYLLAYVPLELVICVLEGSIYTLGIRKVSAFGREGHPMAYAFTANVLSFGLGLLLSFLIPGIF